MRSRQCRLVEEREAAAEKQMTESFHRWLPIPTVWVLAPAGRGRLVAAPTWTGVAGEGQLTMGKPSVCFADSSLTKGAK